MFSFSGTNICYGSVTYTGTAIWFNNVDRSALGAIGFGPMLGSGGGILPVLDTRDVDAKDRSILANATHRADTAKLLNKYAAQESPAVGRSITVKWDLRKNNGRTELVQIFMP